MTRHKYPQKCFYHDRRMIIHVTDFSPMTKTANRKQTECLERKRTSQWSTTSPHTAWEPDKITTEGKIFMIRRLAHHLTRRTLPA